MQRYVQRPSRNAIPMLMSSPQTQGYKDITCRSCSQVRSYQSPSRTLTNAVQCKRTPICDDYATLIISRTAVVCKKGEAISNVSAFPLGGYAAAEKVGLAHHGSLIFFVFAFKAFDCYFDFLTRLRDHVSNHK